MIKIITHQNPHLDEITAIWLFDRSGGKKNSEIKIPVRQKNGKIRIPQVQYWNTGGLTPDGRSSEDWEKDGYILIGVGRGKFDEHNDSSNASEKKPDECSATLVADYLGLRQDPVLEQVLKYVLRNDSKGGAMSFELAPMALVINSDPDNHPEDVIEWVFKFLDAKYKEQYHFFNETKKEFESLAQIETINWSNGRELKFVFIESDSEQMGKFARSEFGCNADIVMIKRSSGNVQIFFNQRAGLKTQDLVKILRVEEQIAQYGEIRFSNWYQLASYGTSYDGDVWYAQEGTGAIMNGSKTANGVPPTKLSNERLIFAIRVGLNPDVFWEMCTGKCTTSCIFYKYGLARCKKMRNQEVQ